MSIFKKLSLRSIAKAVIAPAVAGSRALTKVPGFSKIVPIAAKALPFLSKVSPYATAAAGVYGVYEAVQAARHTDPISADAGLGVLPGGAPAHNTMGRISRAGSGGWGSRGGRRRGRGISGAQFRNARRTMKQIIRFYNKLPKRPSHAAPSRWATRPA